MLPSTPCASRTFGRGDFVKVDCAACHHVALLTPEALLGVGLSPVAKVLDLKGRFRSRGCSGEGVRASQSTAQGSRLILSLATVLSRHPVGQRAQT
jgi:hypothetical protein